MSEINFNYLLGQGKVYTGDIMPNGKPGELRWLLDCSKFSAAFKFDQVKLKENHSGAKSTALVITTGREGTIQITLKEVVDPANLALGMSGVSKNVALGTVSGEQFCWQWVKDGRFALEFCAVSELQIVDSAATPVIVEAGRYLLDPAFGTVTLLGDQLGLVMPLRASYKNEALETTSMMSAMPRARFVRYEGINLADGKPIIVEFYRVVFEPAKDLDLIGDKEAEMAITGEVLLDTTRPKDSDAGQFGRFLRGART